METRNRCFLLHGGCLFFGLNCVSILVLLLEEGCLHDNNSNAFKAIADTVIAAVHQLARDVFKIMSLKMYLVDE